MVSKKEAILNLFETKGSREVWLDRFAASNPSTKTPRSKVGKLQLQTILRTVVEL